MGSVENVTESDLLLTLRSVLDPSCSENSLSDRITRINFQRADLGGFRSLTEEILREEIAGEKNTLEDGIVSENDSSEEEEDDDHDPVKELTNAKLELLGQIESAHQAAMLALDFISLSLTKYLPNQADSTVSPDLHKLVGMGTLGIEKIHASRITESQQLDSQLTVTGWQIQSLDKVVDSVLASAARLEKEIELETKYWGHILDVSNNGWTICCLPSERQTLGVQIGFSEASPEFQNRSLAALRRNYDGSVSLDQGLIESIPQVIRVRILTNGNETGTTSISTLAPDDSPVEALILEARNTIFAEELWQELQREARSLLGFGVTTSVSTINCVLTPSKSALIDLVSLSPTPLPPTSPKSDDYLAQFIHLTLHLSLRWAHRQARRQRAQPQQPSKNNAPQKSFALIRPLLTRLAHERIIARLIKTLLLLTSVLKKASIPASYIINRTSFPAQTTLTKAEQVLTSLTAHLETIAIVRIIPGTELSLTTRTSTSRDMIPAFQIKFKNEDGLQKICPSPGIFHNVSDVEEWLFWYTGCALTSYFLDSLPNNKEGQEWCLSLNPNILKRDASGPTNISRLISVNISQTQNTGNDIQGVRLRVSWEKFDGLKQETNLLGLPMVKTNENERERQEWKGMDMYDWIIMYENITDKGMHLDNEEGLENLERDAERGLLDVIRPVWNFQGHGDKKSPV